MFTIPTVVTSNDLTKRSYVTFYYNNVRIREYNAKNIGLRINPNRVDDLRERTRMLETLRYELHKALEAGLYSKDNYKLEVTAVIKLAAVQQSKEIAIISMSAHRALYEVVRTKLRSELSKKYKRNLKSIYRQFRSFMTDEEKQGSLKLIKSNRLNIFLTQFGSTGTYYMNKRRDLGVLFTSAGVLLDQTVDTVKTTSRRKTKAVLHEKYEKEQLNPILNYLKQDFPKLYLCCLLTYSSWLRPHEEIRLLTKGNFKNELSEVHLSGDENKGGKVRVVYIPEYVQIVLRPILNSLNRQDNIFSLNPEPLNEYYFNTQWYRAYAKMQKLGLIHEHQTIYSFRHTAAVATYKKTKDIYLLQKLLGHSTIVVTLKYLRSLGEFNSEELRDAAPTL